MPISISSQVLGTLSVTVAETTGTLEVAVLATAPAVLSVELGTPGPAATVTVGSTTTLSAGSSATVTNSGSSLAAVLNFGIPAGPAGANGTNGTNGVGVPANGLEGQVLIKNSDTSYDTVWADNYATELRVLVRNETGATLTKGTVVYINGSSANKVTVTKAIATGDSTSAQTLGVMTANLPTNQNGYATVLGLVTGLDTTAYTAGAQLYLSPTTAGALTETKPSAPDHMVYVAIVERVHANQGSLMVRVQNGYELEELHNVAISSVVNGDLLVYESSTSLWKNKSVSTLGLATQSWVTSQGYITSSALSPYLTSATAASLYQPIGSYLTDAPSDGSPYVRKNGAWEQLVIS